MNRFIKHFIILFSLSFLFVSSSISNETLTLSDLISCKRTITELADKSFKVEIKITKGKNEGTAKLLEQIPTGFTAEEDNSAEGYFAFKNNQVKITWMTLPIGKVAFVTYILKPENASSKEYEITGKFHYFEDKVTKSTPISASTFNHEGEKEVAQKEIQEEKPKQKMGGEEITPSGIVFKIQIAAGKNEMPKDFFEKTYGITEQVDMIEKGGIYKYTIGLFKDYFAASGHKNSIKKKGIEGAYVVAFYEGKRISVPKALEIQNKSK